jgi:hypothetical protein
MWICSKSRLKDHAIIHSAVSNYFCDLCDHSFKSDKWLKDHKRRSHNVIQQAKISSSPTTVSSQQENHSIQLPEIYQADEPIENDN